MFHSVVRCQSHAIRCSELVLTTSGGHVVSVEFRWTKSGRHAKARGRVPCSGRVPSASQLRFQKCRHRTVSSCLLRLQKWGVFSSTFLRSRFFVCVFCLFVFLLDSILLPSLPHPLPSPLPPPPHTLHLLASVTHWKSSLEVCLILGSNNNTTHTPQNKDKPDSVLG